MREIVPRYKKAFGAAIIVFTVCILFASFFVWANNQKEKKKLESSLISGVEHAGSVVSEKLKIYKALADQNAQELSAVNATTDQSRVQILKHLKNEKYFDSIYYCSLSGQVYLDNGQMIYATPDVNQKIIEKIDFSSGAQVIADADINAAGRFVAIAPVYQNDAPVGFFAGYIAESDFINCNLSTIAREQIVFLVNKNGTVMMQDSNYEQENEFSDISNINVNMQQIDIYTEDRQELISNIIHNKTGKCELREQTETYEVFFTPIKESNGWTYLCLSNKDDVYWPLYRYTRRNILSILLIIFLVMGAFSLFCYFAFQMERKMEKIAFVDSLTGAKSKNYFRMEGKRLLQEEKNVPYVVATIDIVNFRYVNEVFGHERGNEILKKISELVLETMGTRELLARNTADLFEALFIDLDDMESRFTDISDKLNEFTRGIDISSPLILRIGYCKVKKHATLSELLDKANMARKTVGYESVNTVVQYSSEMQNVVRKREEIESAMENALAHGEFKVFLQPKIDVFTEKAAGGEALVRWIKRDGSMIYPDQFIPIFEQNGFVEKLDFYMLESVCKLLAKMKKNGYHPMPISVNQSRVLLKNPEYVNRVKDVIQKYCIPDGIIELELTETVFFDDKKKMKEILSSLRENNITIDIDDFGSGYSSLNMIKDIPFNILKIDRDFFGESDNGTGKVILKKIVEMAQELDVQCICEGVETKEQVELLREINCRYAQGFYYARPMPAEEFFEKYVAKA